MFGRKKPKQRVVFIDGIPIDAATLGQPDQAVSSQNAMSGAGSDLTTMDPHALFQKYDADGSGGIDFDEFKKLMKDLHVDLSEPKLLAYFRKCDVTRRGAISFEEFRLALFACDPKNPSRTGGFCPGRNLSPKDVFDMFEHNPGEDALDRTGFAEALEFLGIKKPLHEIEALFQSVEEPETETMGYYAFKKLWLQLVDVRKELQNRGEKFNRFLPISALTRKLEKIITQEEKTEANTLSEASRALAAEPIYKRRKELVQEAKLCAQLLLSEAIDAAGQVYVFGKGAFNRFDGESVNPDFIDFLEFDRVLALWSSRVRPQQSTIDYKTIRQRQEEAHDLAQGNKRESMCVQHKKASDREFGTRQVALNTVWLWGKRVSHVACGSAVAYALTDAGQAYCWGGNTRKWDYFYSIENDISLKPKKPEEEQDAITVRASGYSSSLSSSSTSASASASASAKAAASSPSPTKAKLQHLSRPLTSRSEMLKTSLPIQVGQNAHDHSTFLIREKFLAHYVRPMKHVETEAEIYARMYRCAVYYGLINEDQAKQDLQAQVQAQVRAQEAAAKASASTKKKTLAAAEDPSVSNPSKAVDTKDPVPSNPAQPAAKTTATGPGAAADLATAAVMAKYMPTLGFFYENLEPELNTDDLVLSLKIRGLSTKQLTRVQLLDAISRCFLLEIECVGMDYHNYFKQQDAQVRRLAQMRQDQSRDKLIIKLNTFWQDLKSLHEEIDKGVAKQFEEDSAKYLEIRGKILAAQNRFARIAKESVGGENGLHAPQNTISASFSSSKSTASGITAEAFASDVCFNGLTARGPSLKNFDGQQALVDISTGSRHVLAIKASGKLFTWGVGSFSRLGHGQINSTSSRLNKWHEDAIKPQVIESVANVRFRQVACGFSHSLALSSKGQVYVWGSASMGKLGLGELPLKLECFCIAPTIMRLGPNDKPVRRIACGVSHSALVTLDGELYVWGSGDGGRLGLGDERLVCEDRIPRKGKLGIVMVPTKVTDPLVAQEKFMDVSCGAAHTVAVTCITRNATTGEFHGGKVFATGSAFAMGTFTPSFVRLRDQLDHVLIKQVSCGASHTALVSADGEMFSWGNNKSGCTGHPRDQLQIDRPTRVTCMYQKPEDMTRTKQFPAKANQSSQNAACAAAWAIHGTGPSSNNLANNEYAQTQQENCPFWEVELGVRCKIERVCVRLRKPPTEIVGDDPANAKRTPSYFILISELAFEPEIGRYSLSKARGQSTAFVKVNAETLVYEWQTPLGTFGQFVRIQLDYTNMLGVECVQVFGQQDEKFCGPRVDQVMCHENVTIAICRPLTHTAVRERYVRSIHADPSSRLILQQLETFHKCVEEEAREIHKQREEEARLEQKRQQELLLAAQTQRRRRARTPTMTSMASTRTTSANSTVTTTTTGLGSPRTSLGPRPGTASTSSEYNQRRHFCVLCTPKQECAICQLFHAFPEETRLSVEQRKNMPLEEVCDLLASLRILTQVDDMDDDDPMDDEAPTNSLTLRKGLQSVKGFMDKNSPIKRMQQNQKLQALFSPIKTKASAAAAVATARAKKSVAVAVANQKQFQQQLELASHATPKTRHQLFGSLIPFHRKTQKPQIAHSPGHDNQSTA